MTDIKVINHGSIFTMDGVSVAGSAWMDEHLPEDGPFWGSHAYVVEPRYVEDIVNGARADGLEVT